MHVWVLVPDHGTEGYGEPIRAYSSEDAAKADWKALGRGCYEMFYIDLVDSVQEL